MSKIDKMKLVEAYHMEQLRGKDKATFKRLLQEDSSFQSELDAYEAIFDGFQGLRREQFAQTLTEFENDYQAQVTHKKPTIVRSLRQYFYMGAAAALLIFSVLVYQLSSNNLFNQNFAASEIIAVDLSSSRAAEDLSAAEQVKRAALEAYRNKDYKTCIQLLSDYRQNFPQLSKEDYQSIVVLGIAQLAQGKATAALKTLNDVTNSSDSSYRQEAEWMKALVFIKLDRKVEAAEELKDITTREGHLYQKKASVLLEKL